MYQLQCSCNKKSYFDILYAGGGGGGGDLANQAHTNKKKYSFLAITMYTFQFTENVLGSEPGEGLITGVTELHGCVQSELHLIYPTQYSHTQASYI